MQRIMVILAVLAFLAGFSTLQAEIWDPSVIPERGVDYYDWGTFQANYSGYAWEIKNVIEHQDGYLGAYNVHDEFTTGFTVGIVGGKASVNMKSCVDPVAEVWVMDESGNFDYTWDPKKCSD